MISNQNNLTCCTLCPAMCRMELVWKAPDIPAIEYPTEAGAGLCPRGSALGELLGSPYRIRRPVDIEAAVKLMADGATVLIDGNLPLEEIAASAEIVSAWDGVRLCCVVAPEDEQLLLGIEATGAVYLADDDLAGCDGFVVVGDAFAANPRCACNVMDALAKHRRAPLVVIDAGGSVTAKFATRRIICRPGDEADVLIGNDVASIVEGCKRLGVIVSAEAGRGNIWRRVGYQAGELAKSHGGGVSAQTVGANALASVRLNKHLGLLSPAKALRTTGVPPVKNNTGETPMVHSMAVPAMKNNTGETPVVRSMAVPAMKNNTGVPPVVPIGVDILGMMGWAEMDVPVAAAALPNCTTESAQVVLPVALACEMSGTYLQAGTQTVKTSALLPPPAGVPTISELLRALAQAAGVNVPPLGDNLPSTDRISIPVPDAAEAKVPDGKVLIAARHAARHGEGALTAYADWQKQSSPLPEIRISQADAADLGLRDLAQVEVETELHKTFARLRIVKYIRPGTLAISESYPEARRLMPYVIDAERDAIISNPTAVAVGAVEPVKAQ